MSANLSSPPLSLGRMLELLEGNRTSKSFACRVKAQLLCRRSGGVTLRATLSVKNPG
jgi:hypothetical protein